MAAAGRGCLTLCHVGSGCAAPAGGRTPAERCCPRAALPLQRALQRRGARRSWKREGPAALCHQQLASWAAGRVGVVDGRVHGASSSDGIFPPSCLDLPFLLFPVSPGLLAGAVGTDVAAVANTAGTGPCSVFCARCYQWSQLPSSCPSPELSGSPTSKCFAESSPLLQMKRPGL